MAIVRVGIKHRTRARNTEEEIKPNKTRTNKIKYTKSLLVGLGEEESKGWVGIKK